MQRFKEFITEYKEGFTGYEIQELLELYPEIDNDYFYETLGVNTGAIVDDELLTYHCDIEWALQRVL